MSNIGYIPISAKPYHIGHHCLIETASKENDIIIVFVSLSDRKRNGECSIYGTDMRKIWTKFLIDIMPRNAQLDFGGNPIKKIYAMLGQANENNSKNIYKIYGDPDDLARNFPESAIQKYLNNLWGNGQIQFRALSRTDTVDISGTKMREFIAKGDKSNFFKYLPRGIDKEAIWDILYDSYLNNIPKQKTFTLIF